MNRQAERPAGLDSILLGSGPAPIRVDMDRVLRLLYFAIPAFPTKGRTIGSARRPECLSRRPLDT